MHGLTVMLGGLLLGIILMWGLLLWMMRYRKKARGRFIVRALRNEVTMTAEQLVDSWTKSS